MSHPVSNRYAPALHRPLTCVATALLTGLLLTAGAHAQQAAASQPDNTPRWAPEQVAPKQLPPMTTPEQIQVRDRANARWQVLVAGDYAKSYAFTSPTARKTTTEEDYLKQFGAKPQWHGAEVVAVTCEKPTSCVARVRMDMKVSLPRTTMNKITTHGDETWQFEEGQWWYIDNSAQ